MNKNKTKAPKQSLRVTAAIFGRRIFTFAVAHIVVIIFLVAGAAIGMALMQSRSLLNPARNEAHYQDLALKNKYSKVDYTLVNKLQKSINDKDIVVNPNLAPNRKNPFSE